MALDADMQHLYAPFVETFARIRRLEGEGLPRRLIRGVLMDS